MTELLLTNSAGGEKSVFTPVDPEHIRMYVCGPTVYNLVHIGNARPVVVFDTLFRVLQALSAQEAALPTTCAMTRP